MSEKPLLIKNGRIPNRDSRRWIAADILAVGGVITEIGDIRQKKNYSVYDARGNVIFPAFTDMRTNVYLPPYIRTEKLSVTAAAAASGGFGRLCTLPNIPISAAASESIESVMTEGERFGVEMLVCGSTVDQNGVPTDIDALFDAGAFAVFDDGRADADVLYNAARRCAATDRLLIVHATDRSLDVGYPKSFDDYRKTSDMSTLSEDIATSRALTIAAKSGCRMHMTGVSSGYAADLIRSAKKSGIGVSADSCPQYFSMTSSDLMFYGTSVKLSHPLRSEHDREMIVEAIADGTIDAISTDHRALTVSEKMLPFERTPCGMLGLQTAFSAAFSALVLSGAVDLYRLYELMSSDPARLVGRDADIAVGKPARLTVCDIDAEYIFDESMLKTGRFVRNSPYLGQILRGAVVKTF